MTDLRIRAIRTLANKLKSLGCDYAIEPPEGLDMKPLRHGLQSHGRKRGEVAAYVRPLIQHLKPGQDTLVPYGDYKPKEVSVAASAVCYHLWGKGNFMTAMIDAGVQVLCLDHGEAESDQGEFDL